MTLLGARRPHPRLDFRTHQHPVDELPERFDQEGLPLVAAVEAYPLSEQAGGDAETDAIVAHRGFVTTWSRRRSVGLGVANGSD